MTHGELGKTEGMNFSHEIFLMGRKIRSATIQEIKECAKIPK
jgi:hypothetical protein